MKYIPVRFWKLSADAQAQADCLGNPKLAEEAIGEYRGRWTEWSAEEVQLDGRILTKGARKLLTDAPPERCRESQFVSIGEERYRILDVWDLNGRWRALVVERYRQKAQAKAL